MEIKLHHYHLFTLLIGLLIIAPSMAYNVSYSVSPIANAQLTDTCTFTHGCNISVMRIDTPAQTKTVALAATSYTVGATRAATLYNGDAPNISTMTRVGLTFPIQIPANATIINASLILYMSAKTVTMGSPDLYVTNFTPVDRTNQVTTDYIRFYVQTPAGITGIPVWNDTPCPIGTWTAATRRQLFFNSDGIAAITAARNTSTSLPEGLFVVGLRSEWDMTNNNRTITFTNITAQSGIFTLGSMQAVTHTQDPMLNITYQMPDSATSSSSTPTTVFDDAIPLWSLITALLGVMVYILWRRK